MHMHTCTAGSLGIYGYLPFQVELKGINLNSVVAFILINSTVN